MNDRLRIVALAALFSFATAAVAHHEWTDIDTTKTVTLTGTVKSVKWENPHAMLVLEADDHGTKSEWTVMLSSVARMQGRGLTQPVVAAGHALTIVASPARDGSHMARANRIRGDGKEYVLY